MAPSRDQLAQAQQRTLDRLAKVKEHFDSPPGKGRFAGKVGIVTGVGSLKGIGRATVKMLAREGAKALYVLDFDGATLPELADELKSLSTSNLAVYHFTGDAASSSLIKSICEASITQHGRLDFFFGNAGTTGSNFGPISTVDEDVWADVMRINVLSCFLGVQHASAAMLKNPSSSPGGSIVLTASVAGIRSGAGPIDYSASKAAVINLANTAANQLQGTGIRVNAICPGLIETNMTTTTFQRAQQRGTLGKVGQLNPLRRFGAAEEIAAAALFLASDDSSYVNGIALPVDGGLSSSLPVVPGQSH